MSKLTKKQRRKKIAHKKKLKKAAWENECANKLIENTSKMLNDQNQVEEEKNESD